MWLSGVKHCCCFGAGSSPGPGASSCRGQGHKQTNQTNQTFQILWGQDACPSTQPPESRSEQSFILTPPTPEDARAPLSAGHPPGWLCSKASGPARGSRPGGPPPSGFSHRNPPLPCQPAALGEFCRCRWWWGGVLWPGQPGPWQVVLGRPGQGGGGSDACGQFDNAVVCCLILSKVEQEFPWWRGG